MHNASPVEIAWTLIAVVCAWQTALTWWRTRRRVQRVEERDASDGAELLILRQDRRTAAFRFGVSLAFGLMGLAAMTNPAPQGRSATNPASLLVGGTLIGVEVALLTTSIRDLRDRVRLLAILDQRRARRQR